MGRDISIGKIIAKIPIGAIRDITLTVDKKTKALCFVIILNKEKQLKILAQFKMKPITKLRRKFQLGSHELGRRLISVLQRNFILLTNDPFPIIDKVSASDLA